MNAGMAIQGGAAHMALIEATPESLAKYAWDIADAMLAQEEAK